jgi:hypothetical protein
MIMDITMFRDPETPLTEEQRLLRKMVAEKITSEPKRFDMRTWSTTRELTCNTTACLAGWAIFLAGQIPYDTDGDIAPRAIKLLGLTEAEYDGDLFYTTTDDALRRITALAEA